MDSTTIQFTSKDAATLRRIDRKIGAGKATRAEVVKAIDLKRKRAKARG